MAPENQAAVDTVIIGNGPSSLILSYILHGHIPYYTGHHHDQILDNKLRQQPNLLKISPDIYNHFRSSLKYSTQALPVNTLLDTLFRPHGDTSATSETCIQWRYEPQKAIKHVVLGSAMQAGGQWIDNPVDASLDIGALSYAEQLSLPGYSFEEHWIKTKGQPMPELSRPTRRDISDYYASYPAATGISDSIRTSTNAHDISRRKDGFFIGSHSVHCKHLVLASGVFSINLPPPRFLSSLTPLSSTEGTILVVGSGFTAADIIISTPPDRKIIHLFNWDPENRPSPLKACHSSAYPEYATVYRQMKLAASKFEPVKDSRLKLTRIKSNTLPSVLNKRDWLNTYEGLPNTRILSTFASDRTQSQPRLRQNGTQTRSRSSDTRANKQSATIELGRSSSGFSIRRTIGSFRYAVGRRGNLGYLSPSLLREVLKGTRSTGRRENAHLDVDKMKPMNGDTTPRDFDFAVDIDSKGLVALHTLRSKLEDWHETEQCGVGCNCDFEHPMSYDPDIMEVATNVFAIGSLTGDSLVRFALGGCCIVAGHIIEP